MRRKALVCGTVVATALAATAVVFLALRLNSEPPSATGPSRVSASAPDASALTAKVLTAGVAAQVASDLTSGDARKVIGAIRLPVGMQLNPGLVSHLRHTTITVKPGTVFSQGRFGGATFVVTPDTGDTHEWTTVLAYDNGRWKVTYSERAK